MLIDLKKHRTVIAIGDLHGDMLALHQSLELSGCVRGLERVRECAETCPRGESKQVREESHCPNFEKHVSWVGGSTCVVFLGDIVDNRRSQDQDRMGVCGREDTQTRMLEILADLRKKAQRQGGNIVIVLGNHDIGNLCRFGGISCKKYAPRLSRRGHLRWPTCEEGDEDAFTAEHRRQMYTLYEPFGFHTMALVHHNHQPHAILCHGGLNCDPFIQNNRFTSIKTAQNTAHSFGIVGSNVQSVNLPVQRMLKASQDIDHGKRSASDKHQIDIKFVLDHTAQMPYWCRPMYLRKPEQLIEYFNCNTLVVGHTITDTREPICTRQQGGGHLCRIDVGASRAFDFGVNAYGGVRLKMKNGHLDLKILKR
jgi:hypothetical protein